MIGVTDLRARKVRNDKSVIGVLDLRPRDHDLRWGLSIWSPQCPMSAIDVPDCNRGDRFEASPSQSVIGVLDLKSQGHDLR